MARKVELDISQASLLVDDAEITSLFVRDDESLCWLSLEPLLSVPGHVLDCHTII